jgi:hypothetical protein
MLPGLRRSRKIRKLRDKIPLTIYNSVFPMLIAGLYGVPDSLANALHVTGAETGEVCPGLIG